MTLYRGNGMEALLLLIIFIIVAVIFISVVNYETSQYQEQTRNSFFEVFSDKGKNGEYELVSSLERLDGYKRFIINCYLPASSGGTSEVDVILLHESGIYVLEEKNYDGWIFGSENQQYWTETFYDGHGGSKKYRFYNPIYQNNTHIKNLRRYLNDSSLPFYSGIVFSDRCELKKINLSSGKHCVVKCRELLPAIQRNMARMGQQLTPAKIDELYEKLYPLTQVSEEVKKKHIEQAERAKWENKR